MRRMQQPSSDGPVPSPIPTTTTSPSPSRTASSTAATSTTTAMHSSATSRSQRQPSPAMAHRRSTAAASSASSARSHGPGLQSKHADQHEDLQSRARSRDYRNNTNRTLDAADSKEQESISTQDSHMRDYKASDCRQDLQHEQNSDESSEQYSADEDFEEADVPPPSYDALMRQSHSSLQAKESPPRATSIAQRQHQQRSTGEVLSRQTISSRRDKASPTTMRTASATSSNITLSDTAGMTFAERAAARRQRSLLLRKQAEERVQEKTQLKITTERYHKKTYSTLWILPIVKYVIHKIVIIAITTTTTTITTIIADIAVILQRETAERSRGSRSDPQGSAVSPACYYVTTCVQLLFHSDLLPVLNVTDITDYLLL